MLNWIDFRIVAWSTAAGYVILAVIAWEVALWRRRRLPTVRLAYQVCFWAACISSAGGYGWWAPLAFLPGMLLTVFIVRYPITLANKRRLILDSKERARYTQRLREEGIVPPEPTEYTHV